MEIFTRLRPSSASLKVRSVGYFVSRLHPIHHCVGAFLTPGGRLGTRAVDGLPFSSITSLDLSGNRISDDGVGALAGFLGTAERLAKLDLRNNFLTVDDNETGGGIGLGASRLMSALRKNPRANRVELRAGMLNAV